MTRVRTYSRRQNGRKQTVRQHDRRGQTSSRGMKLRPERAWRNAKRAHMSLKRRKRLSAALFAGAALSEIAFWGGFKIGGGLLFVTGIGLALLGAGLRART